MNLVARLESILSIGEKESREAEVDFLFQQINGLEDKDPLIEKFLDHIWVKDVEIQDFKDDVTLPSSGVIVSAYKERISSIVKRISEKKYIDSRLLKARLEIPLLFRAGLVTSFFEKKAVRMNTSMMYRQHKFNLLHEESEGFAKVIYDLSTLVDPKYAEEDQVSQKSRAVNLMGRLRSYIGYFSLDPNRVLDLVLDAFIANVKTSHELFITLLKVSPWSPDPDRDLDMHYQSEIPIEENQGITSDVVMQDVAHDRLNDASSGDIQINSGTDDNVEMNEATNDLGEMQIAVQPLISQDSIRIDSQPKNQKELSFEPSRLGNRFIGQLLGERYRRHFSGNEILEDENLELLNITTAILIHEEIVCMLDVITYLQNHAKAEYHLDELAKGLLEIGDFQNARYLIYQMDFENLGDGILDRLRSIFDEASAPIYAVNCVTGLRKTTLPTHTHFYRPRADIIPKFQTLDELKNCDGEGFELMMLIGHGFARDVRSLTKLVRLALADLEKSKLKQGAPHTKEQVQTWLDAEISWIKVIRKSLLPSLSLSQTNPSLVNEVWAPGVEKAQEAVDPIVRRATKENAKEYSRPLGKASHQNPIVVSMTMIHWAKMHDNMITVVVDMCKHMSELSFDVATYLILDALSDNKDPGKKMKDDGVNWKDWITNLSKFCGHMCKKYDGMCMEAILSYIDLSLSRPGQSHDLVVIAQLVEIMSGISPLGALSATDVSVIGASETCRKEQLYKFSEKLNMRKSTRRLVDALRKTNLAFPLVKLLAVIKYFHSYKDQSYSHIKLMTNNCQSIFVQYCEFLSYHLPTTEKFPRFDELRINLGLEPEAAFRILRKHLGDMISKSANNKETSMIWQPGLLKTIEQVKQTLKPSVWEKISPEFYTTFWQLQLYDINYPKTGYQDLLSEVTKQLEEEEQNRKNNKKVKKDKEKALKSTYQKVEEELKDHEAHVNQVKRRLLIEKDHWFSTLPAERKEIVNAIWQHCLFPRLYSSAEDALFCAKFIESMHEIGTANFSTLTLYDQIFAESVQIILFSLTDQETRHYGRFLNTILDFLSKLHSDQSAFVESGQGEKGLPGFIMKWPTQNRQAFNVSKSDLINYQEFREVFHKWHCKLRTAFIASLNSTYYNEHRNALIALSCISKYFPAVSTHGESLQKAVGHLIDTTGLDEIRLLATSYSGILGKKTKTWVPKAKFYTPKPDRKNAPVPSTTRLVTESTKTDKSQSSTTPSVTSKSIPVEPAKTPKKSTTPVVPTTPASNGTPPSNVSKTGAMLHPLPKKPKPEMKLEKNNIPREERRERPERERIDERQRDRTNRLKPVDEPQEKREEKRAGDHHRREKERLKDNEKSRDEKPKEVKQKDDKPRDNSRMIEERPREIREERRSNNNDRQSNSSSSVRRHDEQDRPNHRTEPSPRKRPREEDSVSNPTRRFKEDELISSTSRRPKPRNAEELELNRSGSNRHASSTSASKRERDHEIEAPGASSKKTKANHQSNHQSSTSSSGQRPPIKLQRQSTSSSSKGSLTNTAEVIAPPKSTSSSRRVVIENKTRETRDKGRDQRRGRN
ncbi:hypothetical protein G9A89_011618 [Geosiphon pyriformis]|nr:hypothetical protein G9A89_011618 [Geosiphon pyriformis]